METIAFDGEGIAADLLPVEELADCGAAALAADGERILSYGAGAGYTPLRELLAERFGVAPHRVVLTNGWHQGLAFLAESVRGRQIVVEYPNTSRVLRTLLNVATVQYLSLSADGFPLSSLEFNLRANNAALYLTTPTFQNPTGITMPYAQRTELLRLLSRYRAVTVEDDSFGLLRYDGEPLPTLFELSGGATVYSTSLSYTLAPGLRVGVLVLPDGLARRLGELTTSSYITPALLAQATVFEFIQRGAFDDHVATLIEELAARRDAMLSALERHLPAASWLRPEGGLYVLVSLPETVNAKAMLARAEGVTALAGDDFTGRPNTMRLNFAACGRDEIEPGVERVAAALALATSA